MGKGSHTIEITFQSSAAFHWSAHHPFLKCFRSGYRGREPNLKVYRNLWSEKKGVNARLIYLRIWRFAYPCQQIRYCGAAIDTGIKDMQIIDSNSSVIGKIAVRDTVKCTLKPVSKVEGPQADIP
jgi:hypothetical protein